MDASRVLAQTPERREPVAERLHTWYDLEHRRPKSEWGVLRSPDGSVVKDGEERFWYPDGTLRADLAYDHGEPSGHWQRWYPDGTPRYDAVLGDPLELHTTSWWHPNGQLSSQGPERNGIRQGTWTTWHPNGVVASKGDYRDARREGMWSFWDEEGRLIERGLYENGVRVGTWERGPGVPEPEGGESEESEPSAGGAQPGVERLIEAAQAELRRVGGSSGEVNARCRGRTRAGSCA